MSQTPVRLFERLDLPDPLLRAAIAARVGRTHRQRSRVAAGFEAEFAEAMRNFPIAEHADAANAQHYELPPEFFTLMLGPARKYSSCLYESADTTLAQAEQSALAATALHAGLADKQRILELGCGWGSLSLWMAARYPGARIVAVSNSGPQRAFIETQAELRGLDNLRVVTADMNDFETGDRFDRVVSIEMFEHMANWHALLDKVRHWLEPDGRLFLHVFTHSHSPYRFDRDNAADWIAQHFFTGGIMPSEGLARRFPGLFAVERQWRWSGVHYRRTALDWLANFDANAMPIGVILRSVYGADAEIWRRRWRLFLLSTAGLFGYQSGSAWGVSHYRLRPAAA